MPDKTIQQIISEEVDAKLAARFAEINTELTAQGAKQTAIGVAIDEVSVQVGEQGDVLAALGELPLKFGALAAIQAATADKVDALTGHVLSVKENQTTIQTKLQALTAQLQAVTIMVQDIADNVSVPPVEPEEPVDPEPEPEPEPEEPQEPNPMRGANFAGLGNNPQFNPSTSPSKLGTHYRTSAKRSNQPDYFAMHAGHLQPELGDAFLCRMPFSAERLFVITDGIPFMVEGYAAEMEEMIREAHKYGGYTLLDMHNYCRMYQPTEFNADGSLKYPKLKRVKQTVNSVETDAQWFPIGHPGCKTTYPILAEMWAMIAERFKDVPGTWGYGLMNEPHGNSSIDDGVSVQQLWIENVQLIIDEIRAVDAETWITVGGCAYSTAKQWRAVSDPLRNITGQRIMFEAHQYPDENGGGGGSWRKEITHVIDPAARVADWHDVADWCAEVGRPLLAGEFGCPVTYEKADGTTYTVQGAAQYLDQLYEFFADRGILSTQWLAGPGDADGYGNGMDRNDGTLKPNANALLVYIGETATEGYAPPATQ